MSLRYQQFYFHHNFYPVMVNLILDQGAGEILHIQREMSLHLDYCAKFGLSKKEVEEHEEHQGNLNHTIVVL